jgi:peroxiredoxin
MKRFAIKHTLVAALIVVASAGYAATDLAGSPAPDFVLKSVAGANLRLSEYRGQVVMVSFWASWCGDCRAQLEGLSELYSRYEGAGFQLLAVSLDTTRRQAGDAAETMAVGYPVLHDAGGEVGKLYAVEKTPVAVLIDRDGVVRDVFEGYRRGDEETYVERVRALLRE